MSKVLLLAVFISSVALSSSLECNPRLVEWFPHQHSCQRFIICFHGNPLEFSCAPGLHFSPTELKCMRPAEAKCDINFMCPEVDDENNPVYIPDRVDCRNYFVCFKGDPLPRTCADNLWFDVENNWCTFEDDVTCDERTINNPRNPVTTVLPPTEAPDLEDCFRTGHLFSDDDRSYIKSFCVVNITSNYERSEQNCRDRGMELFVIDNSLVQSAFTFGVTNALIMQPSGFFWINGRRESSLEWFTFNPNRAPIYQNIDWVKTDTIDGQISGNCLRYSQQFGPYKAMGASCTSSSWHTCEYRSPPIFSTDMCRNNEQVRDDNGNLLKTMCVVNRMSLYVEAEQTCLQNGMKLFVINNSTVQTAFQRTANSALQGVGNAWTWINGRRDGDEWSVYDPTKNDLYSGITWVQTGTVNGRTSGDCLRFTTQFGQPMRSMGTDCRTRGWFICEY